MRSFRTQRFRSVRNPAARWLSTSPTSGDWRTGASRFTLGDYHASVGPDELEVIFELLRARDPDAVMDGLKALRGLNAPDAVKEILPLLKDENHHVLRDTCRTLAVIGNKDNIPAIEPLLKCYQFGVSKDAQDAIAKLKAKP